MKLGEKDGMSCQWPGNLGIQTSGPLCLLQGGLTLRAEGHVDSCYINPAYLQNKFLKTSKCVLLVKQIKQKKEINNISNS